MTNVNVQDLVQKALEAITPTLTEALAKALVNAQTDDSQQTDSQQTDSKRKGFKRKSIDSTFNTVEGEINVCEYSEKSIAIWGDTKDKTELIDYIKRMGQHDKHKANFVTPLSAIESRPVGWTINKAALDANGGMEEFLDSIKSLGFNVVLRDSVKDVFEANKAARNAKTDTPKTDTPKTDAPKSDSKGKGKGKPKIDPTDAQRASKKSDAPAPAAKVLSMKIKGMCYDNTKDSTHNVVERELIKRGDIYIAQGSKGARIYAKIGTHVEEGYDIFALMAIVKGDVTKNDCEETTAWTAWAKDIIGSVKSGALKASNAIMYAYVDAGDQDAVNAIWEKMQAA